MAFIDYGSKLTNSVEDLKTPEYGIESNIQQEETGYERAIRLHAESLEKLNIDKALKNQKERKKDPALEEEEKAKKAKKKPVSKSKIGKKPEHKDYVNEHAVEEYRRRHPESTESYSEYSEEGLPGKIGASTIKSLGNAVGMTLAITVGSVVADKAMDSISRAYACHKLGDSVTPYIKECLEDMIHFGESLQAIVDSNLIDEFKKIDPEGTYHISSSISNEIKKYTPEFIEQNGKKLEKHFKVLFSKIYKAYQDGKGFDVDNVAMDYSALIFSGKCTTEDAAKKVLQMINTTCMGLGSTFDSRANFYASDRSFTAYLVMTPSMNVKALCNDIDRHLKKLD